MLQKKIFSRHYNVVQKNLDPYFLLKGISALMTHIAENKFKEKSKPQSYALLFPIFGIYQTTA